MNAKASIARRAALFPRDGDIVNLGIGIPTLVADYIPKNVKVYLHSENGILGVGPSPVTGEEDPDLVNAGKLPVTADAGAAYFDSASSFGMIRGGHIDISILGALEIDAFGRIANWAVPGKAVLGVGGAMDLLEGSRQIIATTLHLTKGRSSKIVPELTYPKTSERKADYIITEYAVFKTDSEGLILIEKNPSVSIDFLQTHTAANFRLGLEEESFPVTDERGQL